jgi:REP element-mobilizing transposase RayT
MILTPAGTVIESWWHSISNHFPAVVVDATVVMPNHVHGILMCGTMFDVVGSAPVPSLSRILQWFKGSSTNDYIRGVHTKSWPRFSGRLWQHGYHEHIIRSDEELERFRTYILDNPALWPQDEDNPGVVRCVGAVP